MHGYDLNRDWGPFRQPETSAVRDEILKHQGPDKPRLVFFSISTRRTTTCSTSRGQGAVWPADFADRWLTPSPSAARLQAPAETAAGSGPLSKMWVQDPPIPAVIYEVGDNTDRAQIRRVAQAAAEEMMRLAAPRNRRESPPPAKRIAESPGRRDFANAVSTLGSILMEDHHLHRQQPGPDGHH